MCDAVQKLATFLLIIDSFSQPRQNLSKIFNKIHTEPQNVKLNKERGMNVIAAEEVTVRRNRMCACSATEWIHKYILNCTRARKMF